MKDYFKDDVHYITVHEATEAGIDFENVGICGQIRFLAALGRIKVEEAVYNGECRTLFEYLDYCGADRNSYIKSCLANVQPYLLKKCGDGVIYRFDGIYRVYLSITQTSDSEENGASDSYIQVSSCKERKLETVETRIDTHSRNPENIPVFPKQTVSHIPGTTMYGVELLLQKGLVLIPVSMMARRCENGTYIVWTRNIDMELTEKCSQYIRDLYTSDVKLEVLENDEVFSSLQQISYKPEGNSIFDNVSLLADCISLLADNVEYYEANSVFGTASRKAADFALVTYMEHLYTDTEQKENIKRLLYEWYGRTTPLIKRLTDLLDASPLPMKLHYPPELVRQIEEET